VNRILSHVLFLGPLAALLVALPLAAQHPPLSGLYEEDDWITLADFRHVTAVEAGDGEAYVGTAGGVEILSGLGDSWSGTVTAGDGLPSPVVTALAFDSRGGKLWIGTPLGLAIYDPFRGEVVQDPLRLGSVAVREIRIGRGDASSAGAPDQAGEARLYVLAGGRWHRGDPFTLSAEPVADGEVPAAASAVDLRAIPFLGGDLVRGERSGRPESFRVTGAARLFSGRLVLGTWGANAYLYDPARLSAEPLAYGLAGQGGGALGWDGARLWFSNAPTSGPRGGRSAGSGATVEDRSALAAAAADLTGWSHAYPGLDAGLPSDRVYDVAVTRGKVVFATEGGLAVYDREGGGWSHPLSPATVADEIFAVRGAAGGLWLGTRRGLVALRWEEGSSDEGGPRRDAESEVESRPGAGSISRDGSGQLAGTRDSPRVVGRWLSDRTVHSLAADGRELYAGTDRGLFRLAPPEADPADWTLSPVETAGTEVIDVEVLQDEVVIATDRGVEVLPRAGGDPQLFLVGEGPLDESPLAVAADSSNLWIGTPAGVSRWDRERRLWTEYGLADGLPDLPVLDILIQDGRYVWFSTPGGATRFEYGDSAS
jgi:hypothetical protein